jgi:predicted transposase YbfD/YdcC
MPNISLIEHLHILPDPRKINHNKTRHILEDIIVIAIVATVAGADTWVDIETFGYEHQSWFKRFLLLPHGIPSHDTFARVFALLDASAFEKCFVSWVQQVQRLAPGTVVSIDGKTNRRAYGTGARPLHIVNAYAGALKLTLGQRTVDRKTNEITAIPELLKMLYLKGCIVTTDAMGCQGWIAKKIKEHKADYVLAVKGNQGRLYTDIRDTFDVTTQGVDHAYTSEHGHGREETRECFVTDNLSHVRDLDRWQGLQSICKVVSMRTLHNKTSSATRYFMSSLPPDASKHLEVVRAHWQVENGLHWTLDIAFREDESRARIGHAAKNLALVRKIALNLIRKETNTKGSVRTKRLRAGWNFDYLLDILGITL